MTTTLLQLPCELPLLDGENWWGGRTADGVAMPFTSATRHKVALHTDLHANQGCPFLVSDRGRYLWSDRPFVYEFAGGVIQLGGSVHAILLGEGSADLPGAFLAAAASHFPSAGKTPPEDFFTLPQYNTWIELNHNQTQRGVVEYARGIIDAGYPVGVLMIDAGWFDYFGHLDFHAGRFPSPAEMVRQLHEWGFKVMLWVSPYFSADSREYRRWRDLPGWLLRNRNGLPAILEWWDGYSAHLDLSHPEAMAWFRAELHRLQNDYGIDGFKFDAGDALHFVNRPASWLDAAPVDLCEAWGRLALDFPYNEYRACWKLAGQPVVQRLHDRAPSWDQTGLLSLIPNTIAGGLLGHPFMCPDMIGGGDYLYFNREGFHVDEELFIRWCQASALFPMMQFSSAPWRILSAEGNALCREAALLHCKFGALFASVARDSAKTGEPMLRSMEYAFPSQGYASIHDQFMIGETLLVAPVLAQGARSRDVHIPRGKWLDDCGATVTGPAQIKVDAPLDRLPHWTRQ